MDAPAVRQRRRPVGSHFRAAYPWLAGMCTAAVVATLGIAPASIGPVTPTSADLVPAGALDPTFDDDGIAITDVSSVAEAADAELQSLAGGERILVLEESGERVWRFNPDGTLDTTFGDGGVVETFLTFSFVPRRLAVGPDSSFFLGGYTPSGFAQGVRVAKFDADGSRDFSFGTPAIAGDGQPEPACPGGPFTEDKLAFSDFSDVGVRSDGSVVVVGPGTSTTAIPPNGDDCTISTQSVVLVVAVSASGVPATVQATTAGSQIRPDSLVIGPGNATLVSVAIDSITVNGSGLLREVGVIRYTTALQPDPAFGTDGLARIAQSPNGGHIPIAVEGSRVSVAVAAQFTPIDDGPTRPSWRAHAWNASTGVFDTTQQAIWPPGTATTLRDLTTATGGDLVAVGRVSPTASAQDAIGVATINFTGGPDAGDATDVAHPGPPVTGVGGAAVVRLGDGSMRIAGAAAPTIFGLDDQRLMLLSRLTSAGSFDAGFGPDADGFAVHHGANLDQGRGVTVLPDRRVVAAGGISLPEDTTGFVLRHREDGIIDPTFAPWDRPGIEITRYPRIAVAAGSGPEDEAEADDPDPPVAAAAVEFVVTNGDDDGPGSFRATVELANEATEAVAIIFEAELDVVLTTGEVEYTGDQDLALLGNGSTITMEDEARILHLTNSATPDLHVEALSLFDGEPCPGASCPGSGSAADEPGAGIRTPGDVVLVDTTFENNEAWDAEGGALYAGGSVTVFESDFLGNAAGHGGAIWAAGPVVVTDSLFEDNRGDLFDSGGAIRSNSTVTVTRSTFRNNSSTLGGAIQAEDDVVVVDSTFEDNEAFESGEGHGGAVRSDGSVTVSGSTFLANHAAAQGGGVWAAGGVEVVDTTFMDNTACEGGGAIGAIGGVTVTITRSTFEGNTRTCSDEDGGGGAVRADGDVVVAASTFTENWAIVRGGAIWAEGTATVTDSTFTDNTADGESGVASGGGAIRSFEDVVVSGSMFSGNQAFFTSQGGGAIRATGSVSATNSTFAANSATSEAGGAAIQAGTNLSLTYVTVAANAGVSQLAAVAGTLASFGSVVVELPDSGGGCDVPSTTSSYSYDTGESCGFAGTGDTSGGADPELGALADNGGPTDTMMPAATSPLVNAIPSAACDDDVTVDQRGVPRPQHLGCDIGAVEREFSLDIEVEGVADDPAGRIVIVGSTAGGSTAVIQRLLPDGGADPSFGGGVPYTLGLAGFTRGVLRDVALDADGRIVAVGELSILVESGEIGPFLIVVRLLPDGSPDPDFGSGGVVGFTDTPSSGYGIAVDADGRVVVTGWTEVGEATRGLLVARLLADGSPDPAFGSSGSATGPSGYEGRDVATDGNEVVVAGNGPGWEGTFAFVARYTAAGVLDAGFGEPIPDPDAIPGPPPGPGFAFPFGLEFDPSEEFVDDSQALGVVVDPVTNIVVTGVLNGDIALARLLADGTRDPSFAAGDFVTTEVGGFAVAEDVDLAPDGKIVVTGHVTDARGTRVVVARYLPGIGVLECAPGAVDFGALLIGSASTRLVTCTVTEGTVRVDDVRIAAGGGVDFSTTADTCTGALLRIGETCTVTTRFAPLSAGAQAAVLELEYAGTQGAGQLATVNLRGTTRAVPPDDDDPLIPTLAVDPEEGPVLTDVDVTGEDYDPGVTVELFLDDVPVGTVPGSDVTAAGFTSAFVVPEGTPGGDRTVSGCQRCGAADELVATATFTVTPQLFLDRPLSRPGEVVVATGDGFPADAVVSLSWDFGIGLTRTTAGADGLIRTPVLVFRRDQIGDRELQARITPEEDVVADTPFLVVPGSMQPGDFAVRR